MITYWKLDAVLRNLYAGKANRPENLFRKQEGATQMAKGMTKTALVRHMAEKLEITNKQAAAGLELLADTAVKETKKNGEFTIPGIGKLVKAKRKARLARSPPTTAPTKLTPPPLVTSSCTT